MVQVEEKVTQVKTVASRSIQKLPAKYLSGVNVKHCIESMPEASNSGRRHKYYEKQ
jgi:hypothetical protein